MLNLINNQFLDQDERKAILRRAVFSQPYIEFLKFEVVNETTKRPEFKAKVDVNKDFFITEVKGNWSEVLDQTTSLFDLSIWISNTGESLYRYIKGELLPSAFQTYECRDGQTARIFDDRQREIMPYHVKKNNSIMANARNVSQKTTTADAKIGLAGYYVDPTAYISSRALAGVNESLSDDIRFETFNFTVDGADFTTVRAGTAGVGNKDYILNNDRFARLVLGFQIVDRGDVDGCIQGTFDISDAYRRLKLSNEPIPFEFIGPRQGLGTAVGSVGDQHIYYLPTEYWWEPFAPLKFSVAVTDVVNTRASFELVMLTRTV